MPMKKPATARSVSSASVSSTGSQGGSHGLRSQIGHLLPKHALFQVHIYIDQLSNVPLIGGQFAVRWKFKNVQSGSGLLSKMKSGRGWSSRKGKGKLRDYAVDADANALVEGDEREDEENGESSSEEAEEQASREGSAMYGNLLTTSPPHSAVSESPPDISPPSLPTPNGALRSNTTASSESRSVARGMTEWARLQSYNVRWEHSVNVVVQMDVHRETGDLLPSELKLTVLQRVLKDDPDRPRHPRLGKLFLNLAEYADAGPVTRRYLLRESKTNATLKLTVELEHIGGEKLYKPPPLRKSEVLASVSGLLSNNELLRTSVARQLDAFTHSYEPLDDQSWVSDEGRIDESKLASPHGLRSTENLIEALFNPVPTSSETPSPFTYHVPPTDSELGGSDSSSFGGDNSISADSASAGGGADDSNRSGDFTDPVSRPWWRKIRPSTPIYRQGKHGQPSTPSLPAVLNGISARDA